MPQYFLAKTVRYGHTDDDDSGDTKKIVEQHLVDALTYTETESRIKEILDNRESEYVIDTVTKFAVNNIIEKENSDTYWKVKTVYESMDDNSGKIKKVSEYTLVTSDSVESAILQTRESYSGGHADYEIEKAEKTAILEVFHYEGPERTPKKKPTAQMGIEFGEPVALEDETEEEDSEESEIDAVFGK